MQALKALVAGMGVLIVIAMTVIGYGMIKKAEDPNFKFFELAAEAPTAPPPQELPLAPFGEISLGLPEDCQIQSTQMPSKAQMLVLVGPSGPCNKALLVDLASGRVLGSLRAR
ncbi:hypothetical protein JCM17960_06980 [Magnetospira thiophila]